MAYYLVKAKIQDNLQDELQNRLDRGEIGEMRPFGRALEYSLNHARIDPKGWVVWEEEDYCSPPLAQERAAVLDTYFSDLSIERVPQGKGWEKIESLPEFWKDKTGGKNAL